MGSKYEVNAWVKNENPYGPGEGYGQDYYMKNVYQGNNFLAALWTALRTKRTVGYIRVDIR